MRYMVMSFSVLVMLSSQDLFASAKTDSIVAFLDGAQAKFVWLKWAWCNDNYRPKTEAAAKAEGWSLELMDTREGRQRTLAPGCKDAHLIRISRSGKWVTYVEMNGTTTYIVDLTAASPTKNVLMAKSDCTYWAVVAWWIDPANGDEYAYCLDNCVFPTQSIGGGTGIYKVKLNSNGTIDHNSKVKLTINGLTVGSEPPIDISVAVSADGKKLGAAFPWPNTYILDVPTGRLDSRHHEGFGCQANLAPDNSYRFFHCEGDHQGIYMFDANLSTTNWLVNFRKNLAGYTGPTTGAEQGTDFWAPRWTNHVQYQVTTYPLNGYLAPAWNNHIDYGSEDILWAEDGRRFWALDSSYVKNRMNMNRMAQVYMGKFSPDFKTQEKTISIARDPRYFQILGDGWICNGTTYGNQCGSSSSLPAIRGNRPSGLSVVQSGAFVNVRADAAATVRITDARGRLVRQVTGSGSIPVDTRNLAVGAYGVTAYQQGKWLTKQVTITR